MLNIEESERERERERELEMSFLPLSTPSLQHNFLFLIFKWGRGKTKSFFEEIVQIIQAKLKHNNTESLTLNVVEYTPNIKIQ